MNPRHLKRKPSNQNKLKRNKRNNIPINKTHKFKLNILKMTSPHHNKLATSLDKRTKLNNNYYKINSLELHNKAINKKRLCLKAKSLNKILSVIGKFLKWNKRNLLYKRSLPIKMTAAKRNKSQNLKLRNRQNKYLLNKNKRSQQLKRNPNKIKKL